METRNVAPAFFILIIKAFHNRWGSLVNKDTRIAFILGGTIGLGKRKADEKVSDTFNGKVELAEEYKQSRAIGLKADYNQTVLSTAFLKTKGKAEHPGETALWGREIADLKNY